jgi:hypothetical protein
MERLVVDIEAVLDPSIPFKASKASMVGHEYDAFGAAAQPKFELRQANPFAPPICWEVACIGYVRFEDYVPKKIAIAEIGRAHV